MLQTFDRSGVRFTYPANWTLEVEESADGWTAFLQSPRTAFALVSLRGDADHPSEVIRETLDALQSEYSEIDVETVVDNIAGRPAVGHDIDFLTLDTSISCWTRSIATGFGPLLIMCQTSEYDRAAYEPVLRAVRQSIEMDDEE